MHHHPIFRTIALASGLVLAGCVPRATVHEQPPACSESLYVRLKAAPPDSLSEREWTRLRDLERACESARVASERDRANGTMQTRGTAMSWWMGMTMVGGLAMWLIMGTRH